MEESTRRPIRTPWEKWNLVSQESSRFQTQWNQRTANYKTNKQNILVLFREHKVMRFITISLKRVEYGNFLIYVNKL